MINPAERPDNSQTTKRLLKLKDQQAGKEELGEEEEIKKKGTDMETEVCRAEKTRLPLR